MKIIAEALRQAENEPQSAPKENRPYTLNSEKNFPMGMPDDYETVTGDSWNDVTSDPKTHSYYSIYYSAQESDASADPILELLITDDVKDLVGNGSIIIEYDVISGDLYSVWYAEAPGCYVIEDGRRSDRAGRFRSDVKLVEGYSTGVADA